MSVLHIINSLNFGGAEKLLFDTIPKLKDKGLEVDLMILYGEKTFFFKELEKRCNIKIIKPKKLISVYHISHFFLIKKYIKNYDTVHVHLFPCLYWVAIASIFTKKPPKLLFTEHNTNNRRRNNILFKYLDRFIYKKYDKVIAISDGVKQNLKDHLGQEKNNIIQINNGVDISFFHNSKPYSNLEINLPEDAKIIIQVSSFYPQKDHDTLLKAVSLLPEDTHLILVGNGVLIEEKKKLASDLNITKRVHFLGYRNDVNRLLKTADICVLSSHYEGFGLAIVEGMASGIPCIGSNVKGLSEVLKDAGILFERGDHIQLKNSLEKLLSDKQYYDSIVEKCIKKSKEYDISLMVNKHLKVYNSLKKQIN